jgi:hypothetical protein
VFWAAKMANFFGVLVIGFGWNWEEEDSDGILGVGEVSNRKWMLFWMILEYLFCCSIFPFFPASGSHLSLALM